MLLVIIFLTQISIFRYSLFYNERGIEGWFLSFSSSLIFTSLVSWLFARAGIYSLGYISIVTILIITPATVLYVKQRKERSKNIILKNENTEHYSLLSLSLLSFGIYYAFYPTYYLLGGRDPGLYLTFAIHIAKTGGLNLDLPILRGLYREYGNAIRLGYPGIYSAFARGLSDDPARLIPQFMHLFPSFTANFFSAFGLEGAVRANAVVSILPLWSFFMVCRRLMTYWPALLATVALGLNPAIIWNARITLTETMAMGILFFGVYLLFIAKERTSTAWGVGGAFLLGIGVLNRLDASLNALLILGFSLYASIVDKKLRRVALYSAMAYLLVSTIGFIDGYLNAYPYIYDLWHGHGLKWVLFINYAGAFISLALLSMSERLLGKLKFNPRTLYFVMVAAVCAIVMWFVFAYFFRPLISDDFNARALHELGWYVTPLTFILFPLGLGMAVRDKQWGEWLPLLSLAGICVFIFTCQPNISPDHIWASRRWVPQVIPSILLFSVYGVWKIHSMFSVRFPKYKKMVGSAIAVMVVYYLMATVSFARPYLNQSILEGYAGQYSDLRKSIIASNEISKAALTSNTQLASILTYIFDIKTVLLTRAGKESANRGEFDGYLYIGLDSFSFPSWTDNEIYQGQLYGLYLQKTKGSRPKKLYERPYSLDSGVLAIATNDRRIRINLPAAHPRFGSVVGIRNKREGTIISNGRSGFLQFGPYISLDPGYYMVEWFGAAEYADGKEQGFVDVAFNKGATLIKCKPIKPKAKIDAKKDIIAQIDFVLEKSVNDLEYRFFVNDGILIRLESILLRGVAGNKERDVELGKVRP
ncbi:MAG: glycosyltransferase family 39 protein [Deltaproteobacteria bacterium]|nr:glycosyltransferase family 39 protein [Deltaproteobacteria bacterium]